MRALIAGGGMAGLMTALALRESGVFTTIDVFEQTPTPSTAGAGLNIPPNAARLTQWLGVDLDGGDPKGPHGAIDGGRAAILSETRMVWEDGRITRKPLDQQHVSQRQRRLPPHAPHGPADVPPQAGPRVRAGDGRELPHPGPVRQAADR